MTPMTLAAVAAVLVLCGAHPVLGNTQALRFARTYGPGMVLQADSEAVVWGWGDPGDHVTVQLKQDGNTRLTYESSPSPVFANGTWVTKLPAQQASNNSFTVTAVSSAAQQSINLTGLLFGDVVVCVGQSNMEFPVMWADTGAAAIAAASSFQFIRLFKANHSIANAPVVDYAPDGVLLPWSSVTNETLPSFSAVCFFTAVALQRHHGRPMGLMQATWSGVPLEPYAPPEVFQECPDTTSTSFVSPTATTTQQAWFPRNNSVMFNAMVYPLLRTTVHHILWYQGEGNSNSGVYACRFPALIRSWRAAWHSMSLGSTDSVLPFGFVQLSTEGTTPGSGGNYPGIRWALTADHGFAPNSQEPRVFMAVACDLGDPASPYGAAHPRYKSEVGERLALAARAVAYNESGIYFQGPRFERAYVDKTASGMEVVQVVFSNVGSKGIELHNRVGFQLCSFYGNCTMGGGGHFFDTNVTAQVSQTTISLAIPAELQGKPPLAVVYNWYQAPCTPWLGLHKCAVYASAEQLPVAPFVGSVNPSLPAPSPTPKVSLADQCSGGATTAIKQYNVTFFVLGHPTTGTFANGDTYTVGPVTLCSMTPAFDGAMHGAELNPSHIHQQGFDSRIAGWNASLVPQLPLILAPGDTLVKAVSMPKGSTDHSVALYVAVALSVVGTSPRPGAFRPPYFGAPSIRVELPAYNTDQMQIDILPSLAASPAINTSAPTKDWVVRRFQRLQLDHLYDWISREIHPVSAMPDYGADLARDTGDTAMKLMLKGSLSDRKAMALGYVQYGIDLYGIVLGGGSWPANGGHSNGRKLPMLFASLLLGDVKMQQLITRSWNGTFSEDGELVAQPAYANVTTFGSPRGCDDEAYWKVVVTGDGGRICPDPYGWIDGGAFPGSFYQFCCTSEMWKGTALPLLLWPKARDVCNSTAFLSYVQRWVSFGAWAQPDPCAPPTGLCSDGSGKCSGVYSGSPCGHGGKCKLSMDGYGKEFGPSPSSGCILDRDRSDGIGRFPDLHGSARDQGDYASKFGAVMWSQYGPKQ